MAEIPITPTSKKTTLVGHREGSKKPTKIFEDGELADSPHGSPLKRFDRQKEAQLIDGSHIQDSLKRGPSKAKRMRKDYESSNSSSESSSDDDFGGTNFLQPAHHRASSSNPSISILANGLLDDKSFTSEFSVSDRRDLKGLKHWGGSLKTLISDVYHQGGKRYKEFVGDIESAQKLVTMLLEEKPIKPIKRNLKTTKAFFDLAHRLLNIHEQSQGVGNTIYSLIQSQEFRYIFGAFESELISQSHRIESC